MHFAYPPRKSSHPPPFRPRAANSLPTIRASRLKVIALIGLAFVGILLLVTRPKSRRAAAPSVRAPSGNPPAVIVTVFDETNYATEYRDLVKANRAAYAKKHGYETFLPQIGDYDLKAAPLSWTKVVAMRHALTKFPEATFFWYLEEDALIVNFDVTVEKHLMLPAKLEKLMIRDHPVVPPDSIIKTFSHLHAPDVDFLLTQDEDGLSIGSFVVRNGDWAKFFFETWYDPIYRTYNFQKAETHALEHIIQWHPTVLSKLALVPPRILNAAANGDKDTKFQKDDVVVRITGCEKTGPKSCLTQAEQYDSYWRTGAKKI